MQDTTTPSEMPAFKEFKLNGGMDVDVFYLKSVAKSYKVSIRNRSLKEQTQLEQGELVSGSSEKYITIYDAYYMNSSQTTAPDNVIGLTEKAVYTVPKNADMSVYCGGSTSQTRSFAAVRQSSRTVKTNEYQLAYEIMGNGGGIIED